VVSDLHGRLASFEAALAHARFDPARDRLVTAGDLIDVGEDDVVSHAEALGATVLVGNHEIAAALGLRIFPQNESSVARGDEFAAKIGRGDWKLAAEADGWLITHAGVSVTLSDMISALGTDAAAIAATLNGRFADEFADAVTHRPLSWDDLERYRLLGGQAGPLWFRPMDTTLLPFGIRQMVGHTPPESMSETSVRVLGLAGWLLVDSGGHGRSASSTHFRYGLIEDGHAVVVDE
jgi:hypothetical protein